MNDQIDLHLELQKFLDIKDQFQLGQLPTEIPNPLSKNLSDVCKKNTEEAFELIRKIDLYALKALASKEDDLLDLNSSIWKTIENGKKIFISGCGATGRLAVSIETLWRKQFKDHPFQDRVIGFMAGGDLAFIHSLESFEDHPEYGAKQLSELGFKDGDLLIAVTEGGETPFVIGTVWEALKISKNIPYFLFCNPPDILTKVAERSKEVINCRDIKKIYFPIGSMALAGSTRMQATTVQQLAVGSALLIRDQFQEKFKNHISDLVNLYSNFNFTEIAKFSKWESEKYRKSNYVNYLSDIDLATCLLTDTTERSPTFSLPSFENNGDLAQNSGNKPLSLCYLFLAESGSAEGAWELVLRRKPRALNWPDVSHLAGLARLFGFDLSMVGLKRRTGENFHNVTFEKNNSELSVQYGEDKIKTVLPKNSELAQIIFIKMLMNAHSTIVMGMNGRFESNIMTYVRPSNYKLIDRAIRYVGLLSKEKGLKFDYVEVAKILFKLKYGLRPNQAIVTEVLKLMK